MPFFQPYIGPYYLSGGIFGKRILVLGESHYCDQCKLSTKGCGIRCPNYTSECHDFTINKLHEYLDRDKGFDHWMRTYTKFERSLINAETNVHIRRDIWDSVMFYNYLQVAMPEPRQKGNDSDYIRAQNDFFHVLEIHRPEYIIVWGMRLWNDLPGGPSWTGNDHLHIGDRTIPHGYYLLSDQTPVRAMAIQHPSTGYAWSEWAPVIQAFLKSL